MIRPAASTIISNLFSGQNLFIDKNVYRVFRGRSNRLIALSPILTASTSHGG